MVYFSGESASGSMSIMTFGFAYPVEVYEVIFNVAADIFIPGKCRKFCIFNN